MHRSAELKIPMMTTADVSEANPKTTQQRLADAKKRQAEHDKRIEEFKQQHGRLPTSVAGTFKHAGVKGDRLVLSGGLKKDLTSVWQTNSLAHEEEYVGSSHAHYAVRYSAPEGWKEPEITKPEDKPRAEIPTPEVKPEPEVSQNEMPPDAIDIDQIMSQATAEINRIAGLPGQAQGIVADANKAIQAKTVPANQPA
jgi:hypothetical protein